MYIKQHICDTIFTRNKLKKKKKEKNTWQKIDYVMQKC